MALLAVAGITLTMGSGLVMADDAASVSSDITIDGLYDDWDNVPVTDITYKSINTKSVHVGQIYTDGDYMYVHFKMSDECRQNMPFGQFYITINNTTTELHIFDENGYFSCNAPTTQGSYSNLTVGVRGDVTGWQPVAFTTQIVFSVYNEPWYGGSDFKASEFEFKVPLSEVAAAFHINSESMSTITIVNTTLGTEGVTIAGTPTGAILLSVMCAAIAIGASFIYLGKAGKKSTDS